MVPVNPNTRSETKLVMTIESLKAGFGVAAGVATAAGATGAVVG